MKHAPTAHRSTHARLQAARFCYVEGARKLVEYPCIIVYRVPGTGREISRAIAAKGRLSGCGFQDRRHGVMP